MEKDFFKSKNYQKLVQKLKRMLPATDEENYHESRIKSYWEIGEIIYAVKKTLGPKQKMAYIAHLAEDLQRQKSYFYDIQQFYQRFPKTLPKVLQQRHLKWSHCKQILPIEDPKEALFYLEQAVEDELSAPQMHRAIKRDLYQWAKINSKAPILQRPTSPLFVFSARLLRVKDGDTPDVMVDQGFDTWRKMTVRLRGVNTPELHGPKHELALQGKEFLQNTLGPLDRFILITYKTDSFGRFIGDILYHPVWKDLEKIFYKGIFLNAQMIQLGLAKPMLY